jgi:superfamily I DNA/RNA helicase
MSHVLRRNAAPLKDAIRVAQWISARLREGCEPHEIGVFVRSEEQMERARAALKAAATPSFDLNNENEASEGRIAVGTMHAAKGLEFRSVVVMACDDEIIPLQERIENIADDAALEEVYPAIARSWRKETFMAIKSVPSCCAGSTSTILGCISAISR